MNLLEFISSVLSSISWPVSIIIIVFIFRKSINELLPSVKEIQYNKLKIYFYEKMEEIKSDLSDLPEIEKFSDQKSVETKLKLISNDKVLESYEKLAEVSPKALMLEVWSDFEIIANQIIKKLQLTENYSSISMTDLFKLLNKNKYLSEIEVGALIELRNIRNRIIHTKDIIPISGLLNYATVLHRTTKKLKQQLQQI